MICISTCVCDHEFLVLSAVHKPHQWTYHAHADPRRPGTFFGLCIETAFPELVADYLMSATHSSNQRVNLLLVDAKMSTKRDARELAQRPKATDGHDYLYLGSVAKAWARSLCLQDLTNRTPYLCLQRLVPGTQRSAPSQH